MTRAIGDTAQISLLTGLPGAGKSLRLVQRISELLEKGEHVYACNINGVSIPGLSPWDTPETWQNLPPGAILFVDEAQEYMPARRGGEPPPWVKALSKIRHVGVRIVLATQQPDYLDSYVRGLVGFHEHLYRKNGGSTTFIFSNSQVMDQIRLSLVRIKALYDYEKWSLPKQYFRYYKSAELHTIRYRMPALLKKALLVVPPAIAVLAGTWWMVFHTPAVELPGSASAPVAAVGASAGKAAPGSVPAPIAGGARSAVDVPLTTEEYTARGIPRVPTQPWSAPLFDQVNVPRAEPQLVCVSAGAGADDAGRILPASCTCITEQGTQYVIDPELCETVARRGPAYNPYREPQRQDRDLPDGAQQAPLVPDKAFGRGASAVPYGGHAAYGDMGVKPADASR